MTATSSPLVALDTSSGPTPPGDPELLRRCRAGDAEAWDLLVSRYERLVFSVAMRNGLAREDACDVAQTTFVALLESIFMLRDDERLSSWLTAVARRQSWRVNRRSHRERLVTSPEPHADPTAAWDRGLDLHDAVMRLGSPCRELLVALYFDPSEPSYADVATRLGRSIGGVGPLRARCLGRLRTMLGEGEDEGEGG